MKQENFCSLSNWDYDNCHIYLEFTKEWWNLNHNRMKTHCVMQVSALKWNGLIAWIFQKILHQKERFACSTRACLEVIISQFTIYNVLVCMQHCSVYTHLQGSVYFAKPPLNNLTQHHLMQSLFIKYGVKFRLKASVLYKIRRKMFICCISISSCNLACSFACRWLAAMNKMEWNGTRSLVQKPYKYSHPTPKYLRNIYAIVRSHGIIILGYFFIGAVKHSTRCSSSLSLSLVLLFLWIIHGEWTVNTNQ